MSIEAMNLAQELRELADRFSEGWHDGIKIDASDIMLLSTAAEAIEQAQKQEPEFTAHVVETAYDWSEWVCPDPKSYLMKCCDCGLVHEAEFKVVRYKSEAEREDCKPVDDPNVQAVFRMRRSEQWTPEDMAHRAGGLPIEQAQKQEPVAWRGYNWGHSPDDWVYRDFDDPILDGNGNNVGQPLYTSPPQRQPLTDEQKYALVEKHLGLKQRRDATVIDQYTGLFYAAQPYFDLIEEAAHGIKE